MFNYGKRAGIMGALLLVLAVIPVMVAIMVVPGLPDLVPMKVGAAGEVLREGSRFELLVAPALCFVLSLATYASAGKQARAQKGEAASRFTAERYLRNGLVTAVVLNIANAYLFSLVL